MLLQYTAAGHLYTPGQIRRSRKVLFCVYANNSFYVICSYKAKVSPDNIRFFSLVKNCWWSMKYLLKAEPDARCKLICTKDKIYNGLSKKYFYICLEILSDYLKIFFDFLDLGNKSFIESTCFQGSQGCVLPTGSWFSSSRWWLWRTESEKGFWSKDERGVKGT